MWQAELVDEEKGWCVRALAELDRDVRGRVPNAKLGMQEVLVVLEALNAELIHVSSPAGDSGQNNHGRHQGREPSGLQTTPPWNHMQQQLKKFGNIIIDT